MSPLGEGDKAWPRCTTRIGDEEQLLLVKVSPCMSYIAVMRLDRYGLFSFGSKLDMDLIFLGVK